MTRPKAAPKPCARGCGAMVQGRKHVCDACATPCANGCGRRADDAAGQPYCKPCLTQIELDREGESLVWRKNRRGIFVAVR